MKGLWNGGHGVCVCVRVCVRVNTPAVSFSIDVASSASRARSSVTLVWIASTWDADVPTDLKRGWGLKLRPALAAAWGHETVAPALNNRADHIPTDVFEALCVLDASDRWGSW
jgi:hypothetical protein